MKNVYALFLNFCADRMIWKCINSDYFLFLSVMFYAVIKITIIWNIHKFVLILNFTLQSVLQW